MCILTYINYNYIVQPEDTPSWLKQTTCHLDGVKFCRKLSYLGNRTTQRCAIMVVRNYLLVHKLLQITSTYILFKVKQSHLTRPINKNEHHHAYCWSIFNKLAEITACEQDIAIGCPWNKRHTSHNAPAQNIV